MILLVDAGQGFDELLAHLDSKHLPHLMVSPVELPPVLLLRVMADVALVNRDDQRPIDEELCK
jgi:hypothetical protein